MRESEFRQHFPNASRSLFEANGISCYPEPKRPVPHEPVGAEEGKDSNPARRVVSITCYRVRLTDPDNLCPKYFIDSLRYAGAIPNDREADIDLRLRQEKVGSYAEEKTVIEIL